jgi:hypothetical protein
VISQADFLRTEELIATAKGGRKAVGEFRYVLVRGPGAVEIGNLDRLQSKALLSNMESTFKEREPQIHETLIQADRLF